MRAQFQKIIVNEGLSFVARRLELPRFDSDFHFHSEYELKYVVQSKGKRFVGDCVENFNEGDLVLLGPNIPHYWKNDPEYFERDDLKASAYLVMFPENFFLTAGSSAWSRISAAPRIEASGVLISWESVSAISST